MSESLIYGIIFIGVGIFVLIASIANWDFFFNNRKAKFIVKILSRNGARIFYIILGACLNLFGIFEITGITITSYNNKELKEQLEQSLQWYDTLDIHNIRVNNMAIITDTTTLFGKYGHPESIIEYGGFFTMEEPNNSKYKLGEKIEYQGFIYKGLSFAVWDDQVRLRRINFVNSDLEFNTPKGNFSKMTTIEEIQQIFPNSFEKRSTVKNYIMIDDEIVPDENQYNEPLCLMNGISNDMPGIEMTFENNRLVSIYIRTWQ